MMRALFAALLCLLALGAHGEELQPVYPPEQAFPLPQHYQLVNDFTGLLPPSYQVRLSEKLNLLQRRNGTQIVILVVPSTGSEGVEAYSLRAAAQWDVGNNREGNGVLFLIDGRNGTFYIRTGPGISGAMPDAWIRQLIDQTIVPRWNQEHYLEALEAAIDAMIARAAGEQTHSAFYDSFDKALSWKQQAWIGLGAAAVLVLLGVAALRRRAARQPAWKHLAWPLALLALASAAVAFWPDPLQQLMDAPRIAGKGSFETIRLSRTPLPPASLAVPGHLTVLAITDEEVDAGSTLRLNLKDLGTLRPDVALRVAYLDFKGWNTGTLRHLYGQDMAILPYVMIFDAAGKLVAADQGADQVASRLLDTWHMSEARRAASADLCERPALGC